MADPIVAVDAFHGVDLGLGDFIFGEGIKHVVIGHGLPIGEGGADPGDIFFALVARDVLDGVLDVPVNAVAKATLALATAGLEDEVGALFSVLFVGQKVNHLAHSVTMKGRRPVATLAGLVGGPHGLGLEGTLIVVKEDFGQVAVMTDLEADRAQSADAAHVAFGTLDAGVV
jgi:hypothetical protein